MTQAALDLMTFEEFLEWHPDDGRIFELMGGVPQEVNPSGTHEKLAGFLTIEIGILIRQQQLPYFLPKTATLKPHRDQSGYKPDMVVLDERALANESRWETQSTISMAPLHHSSLKSPPQIGEMTML